MSWLPMSKKSARVLLAAAGAIAGGSLGIVRGWPFVLGGAVIGAVAGVFMARFC